MKVFINKETFEVISEERLIQIIDDAFFNSDKRRDEVKEEIMKNYLNKDLIEAEVRNECSYTQCMYHIGKGCGAPTSPMAGCPKTRVNR